MIADQRNKGKSLNLSIYLKICFYNRGGKNSKFKFKMILTIIHVFDKLLCHSTLNAMYFKGATVLFNNGANFQGNLLNNEITIIINLYQK